MTMNTINSPTAANLARGTIIELAQNVYNNALAAQEQADRAQGLVDGEIARAAAEADRAKAEADRAADVIAKGVNDAADEADRSGVARLAAEAAARAADGAATAADGAWNAATAEADRAEAAADRAEAAAEQGGGIEAITQTITDFPDGLLSNWNVNLGNENPNSFFIVSGVDSSGNGFTTAISVGIILSAIDIVGEMRLSPNDTVHVNVYDGWFSIYNASVARVTFYRV